MRYDWTEKVVSLQGRVHRYRILEHPGSVAVIALREGRLALVRQYRPAVDRWLWEIPAGTLEPGELPQQAAGRELVEETGWQAGRLEELTAFYLAPGYSSERMHLFVATELCPAHAHQDEGEFIDQVRWVDPHGALEMLAGGELDDAKSLAAIGWLALQQGDAPDGLFAWPARRPRPSQS